MKKSIISFIFLLSVLCIGQRSFSQIDPYRNVDSIMRAYSGKVKTVDDLYNVTYFIRKNFSEDSLRLRASFIWITDNIDYDVKSYLNEDPKATRLEYVIKVKKAVCGGYATLLKYFCDAFKIENEIVDGYARTGKKGIYISQQRLKSNHAWNAVKINNTWRLMDPTWAAGTVDESHEKNQKYYRGFNEFYYFMPPQRAILNHLPRQAKFQFLTPLTNEFTFKKQPLFTSDYLVDDIQKVYPETALLKMNKGDTLVIKFKSSSVLKQMCVWSDDPKKIPYSDDLIKKGDWYEFHYPVQVLGYYNIYIGHCTLIQTTALVGYKLDVR